MLQTVHTDGVDFKTSDGKGFTYVGVSDFALFARSQQRDGYHALVAPRLKEWRSYAKAGGYGDGPIVLRVFRYAAPPNRFAIDPWSYPFSAITTFSDYCAKEGFYIDWTCGDSQVVLPNPDGPRGQQQHLNETCAALVPTFAFLETCNEPFKNGIDVGRIIPPKWGTYLRDSGYYADVDWDFSRDLDFVSYHGTRATDGLYWPKWLIDMPVSAGYLLTRPTPKPAVLKEPMRCNREGDPRDPDLFFRMGLVTAFCGVTFHSENGRDGDHLTAHEQSSAEAFFAGAKGAQR